MSDSPKSGFLTRVFKRKTEPSTRQRGRNAEQLAADYLSGRGYEVIERNFECRLGEIDIIAREGKDLVFIEVRSRHSVDALNPVFSVNVRKQKKIAQVAQVYLDRHYRQDPACRFDVVLVTVGPPPEIELIRDAFGIEPF
jgi:putative endonuclease